MVELGLGRSLEEHVPAGHWMDSQTPQEDWMSDSQEGRDAKATEEEDLGFVGPTLVSIRFTPTAQPEQPGRKFVFTTSLNLPGTVVKAIGPGVLHSWKSISFSPTTQKDQEDHTSPCTAWKSDDPNLLHCEQRATGLSWGDSTDAFSNFHGIYRNFNRSSRNAFKIFQEGRGTVFHFLGLKQLPRVSVLRVVI